jgi:hypothetical protein
VHRLLLAFALSSPLKTDHPLPSFFNCLRENLLLFTSLAAIVTFGFATV